MKTVVFTRNALKALSKIAKPQVKLIRAKIDQLAADPESLANNIKALQGVEAFRLRVGNYRVIYTDDLEILAILNIGHRKDIYD